MFSPSTSPAASPSRPRPYRPSKFIEGSFHTTLPSDPIFKDILLQMDAYPSKHSSSPSTSSSSPTQTQLSSPTRKKSHRDSNTSLESFSSSSTSSHNASASRGTIVFNTDKTLPKEKEGRRSINFGERERRSINFGERERRSLDGRRREMGEEGEAEGGLKRKFKGRLRALTGGHGRRGVEPYPAT